VRREKIAVMIYLMSGAKLNGRVKSFDKYSVLLESASHEQLIFKHAISTIQHARRASGELRGAAGHAADAAEHASTDAHDRAES
jgi:host factor-I protein